MSTVIRPALGDYMHMVCFQYLRNYTEEVAGRAPIIAAGRRRGQDVVQSLGIAGSTTDPAEIQKKLEAILGADGTRLCKIESIKPKSNGGYEVHVTSSACTSGIHAEEPVCAFTLGVFIGALYAITGTSMRGSETTCQACGSTECVYQIDPVALD